MPLNLPARGQSDWDDENNANLEYVESVGTAAQATANAASLAATAASAAASAAQATANDAADDAATALATANTALSQSASDATVAAFVSGGASTNAAIKSVIDGHPSSYATFWPVRYGAAGTGLVDDTDALQDCLNAAAAVNGVVIATKKYRLDSPLTVPNGVSLRGISSMLTSLDDATFVLNSGTACIEFEGGDARGGSHGGFNVDCNGTGDPLGAVKVTSVQQEFKDITITDGPGIGFYVYGTQNCSFEGIDVNACENNVVLDGGTGGCVFTRCELTSGTNYDLWLRDSDPGGHAFGYQFGCADNVFIGCILEHYSSSGAALLRIDSGSRNHFIKCGFSVNTSTLSGYVVELTNDDFAATTFSMAEFTSCNFHGGPTELAPIFYVKGTNAITGNILAVNGQTFFQQSAAVFNTDGATIGVIDDNGSYYAATVAAKFGSIGGESWFLWRNVNPTGVVFATPDAAGAWTGHTPIAVRKDSDSSVGARWYIENDGTMGWGDGTNFVAQVTAEPDLTNDVLNVSGIKHNRVVEGLTAGSVTVAATAVSTNVSTGGPEYGVLVTGAGSMASWTLTNPTPDQVITLTIYRDAAQAVAWPANCRFAGGAAPTAPTAGRRNSVTFKYNSASGLWYEQHRAADVPNA